MYGLEACALTRMEENISETTEIRILRQIMGETSREKKSNDDIRKELQICVISAKARANRLR